MNRSRCRLGWGLTHVGRRKHELDDDQGRTNPFYAARGDRMAMRIFVQILRPLVLLMKSLPASSQPLYLWSPRSPIIIIIIIIITTDDWSFLSTCFALSLESTSGFSASTSYHNLVDSSLVSSSFSVDSPFFSPLTPSLFTTGLHLLPVSQILPTVNSLRPWGQSPRTLSSNLFVFSVLSFIFFRCDFLKERDQSHVTRFLIFAHNHIFVIGEAMHFKFRIMIYTDEYECIHDILLPKGMRSESRDLFNFLGNKW